jgi:hypothetical protein
MTNFLKYLLIINVRNVAVRISQVKIMSPNSDNPQTRNFLNGSINYKMRVLEIKVH